MSRNEDYYESQRDKEWWENRLIVWKCDKCGRERREPVGYNEGGKCYCGGEFFQSAEEYEM